MAYHKEVTVGELKAGDIFYTKDYPEGPWLYWLRTRKTQSVRGGHEILCYAINGTTDEVWFHNKDKVYLAYTLKEFRKLASETRYKLREQENE